MSYLKFIYRLILNSLKLLLICLPLEVLGFILVPIALLLPTSTPRLPTCFKWFDCADWYIERDTSTIESVRKTGFWYSYYWLALRNPINYFGYKYLGYQVQDLFQNAKTNGMFDVGDSANKTEGLLITEIDDIYEYYYIKKWSATKCFRFRMGWKIGFPWLNQKGSWIQWVLVIQPWKSYSGN